ncbi:LSU ribosomal protein L14P, putative [Perkinsus marinus ATCC 50983]|uniref:LSU ribosomal protein L14P, putative n=1 Tax=Perkinsus marinus (strain ATCC 50983 / TXsc) TaxID=423536 RepID=C5LDI6_PERM5|nr:LSU ribosomal protein L14P, putative [Perkinsus marinus ATCC 50983]EER05318.1 LSU ribosomal protein L14P, putative [Perkinsus marinus ATCC 50983]|eukprot:XP_002773502.1 LSU ribosomal protein L14P, putative [Perkinsus marinus ATCC 50983]
MGLWQQSVVKCADNCGIFKAVIIGMPKWHHSRGRVGYAFRMAVRDKSREYRGEKLPRGIIVRTKQPIKRKDGSTIKFDENAFIAISNNKPLGNKVKGPVTFFRLKISMTSQDNVVRFGGVPEHFNAPFQRLLQRQAKLDSSACAPQLAWRTYPGGSGAMLKAVISKEVDCACVLTESAVAHIIKNSGKDARDQVRILGKIRR